MSAPARRFGWPPQRCTCGDEAPCTYCVRMGVAVVENKLKERMATYDGVIDAPQIAWIVQDVGEGKVRIQYTGKVCDVLVERNSILWPEEWPS